MNETVYCRICRSPSLLFYEDSRKFFACTKCRHVFTHRLLSEGKSRRYYSVRWGQEGDDWWRVAAERIMWDVKIFHQPKRILNFGSGNGDLSRQLIALGYDVTDYEPMIHGPFRDQRYEQKFDTIIATEVIEHIADIHEELQRLFAFLERDFLFFFTTLISNPFDTADPAGHFSRFWYKDDPTHVNFFSDQSVATLAGLYHCKHIFLENKGFIFIPSPDRDA